MTNIRKLALVVALLVLVDCKGPPRLDAATEGECVSMGGTWTHTHRKKRKDRPFCKAPTPLR
jgi:hypothetical protein